ncbi:metalloregulator ArsR/SmtB family transcription factor [Brachybacterium sp. NBEC-018]|uniref:ArsR/SmtB family transcription factor n=1 Tax=Brachybacterium sp. NBEC-018 TaxID=2996004 RepID=UPI0021755673|nr:metalloregulator ArsR/SmtB family transcription factor [Brachybacterium sp. NBEC-018]UVY84944.1 metalloregulator ArsR/SmtB family transcription factor [Brachybacterium sp. NBEC-018]
MVEEEAVDAEQLSRAFAALADPTRRDLVSRLTLGDAAVGELAAPYDMSLQAVSKHLTVLELAGLVTRRRDAQRRPVHLEVEALGELTDWIDRHRTAAEARLSRLDALLQDPAVGADADAVIETEEHPS